MIERKHVSCFLCQQVKGVLLTGLCLILLAGTTACRAAQETTTPPAQTNPEPQPAKIEADDPNLQYVGRFDFSDPKAASCSWSGSAVRARFEGTAVSVILEDFPIGRKDETLAPFASWFEILIDGQQAKSIVLRPGRKVYKIREKMKGAVHSITVYKRTEAYVGKTVFHGFELSPGGKLLDPPPRPKRKIEFIGDSITAGLDLMKIGVGASSIASENFYHTYAAVTARALDAEATGITYSGNGVHSNAGGGKENVLPIVYSRILVHDPESKWDFNLWTPDVVVINLGANDMGAIGGRCKDSFEEFVGSYVRFIAQIRKNYGDVHIFCAAGPIFWPGDPKKKFATTVVKAMHEKGDKKVYYVQFDGVGGDLHPNAANHSKMADVLIAAICKKTGWPLPQAARR